MEIADELAVIAEIGIAFAGFMSIFLVFASRDGRFSPADSIQVVIIITSGFGTVLNALAPLVLHRLLLDAELALRLGAALSILMAVLMGIYFEREFRQLRIRQDPMEAGSKLSQSIGRGGALLSILLQASVVLWAAGVASPGVYLLALLLGLILGASAFVSLAVSRLLSTSP